MESQIRRYALENHSAEELKNYKKGFKIKKNEEYSWVRIDWVSKDMINDIKNRVKKFRMIKRLKNGK